MNRDFHLFIAWYNESELEKALDPLSIKMWDLLKQYSDFGLMGYWLMYARKYPERLVNVFH